jgi:hypothetical protein
MSDLQVSRIRKRLPVRIVKTTERKHLIGLNTNPSMVCKKIGSHLAVWPDWAIIFLNRPNIRTTKFLVNFDP